jgi:hypothetical protein
MAAAIIFIVLVQLRTRNTAKLTYGFEFGKSCLATALWLWLVFDSAFGPWQNGWRYNDHPEERDRDRVYRLLRSVVALLLPMLASPKLHTVLARLTTIDSFFIPRHSLPIELGSSPLRNKTLRLMKKRLKTRRLHY